MNKTVLNMHKYVCYMLSQMPCYGKLYHSLHAAYKKSFFFLSLLLPLDCASFGIRKNIKSHGKCQNIKFCASWWIILRERSMRTHGKCTLDVALLLLNETISKHLPRELNSFTSISIAFARTHFPWEHFGWEATKV